MNLVSILASMGCKIGSRIDCKSFERESSCVLASVGCKIGSRIDCKSLEHESY